MAGSLKNVYAIAVGMPIARDVDAVMNHGSTVEAAEKPATKSTARASSGF